MSSWDVRLGCQVGMSGWDVRLGCQVGMSSWDVRLGCQVGMHLGECARLLAQIFLASNSARVSEAMADRHAFASCMLIPALTARSPCVILRPEEDSMALSVLSSCELLSLSLSKSHLGSNSS